MILSNDFPNLTPQNHRITSPADLEYNCIAWSAGDVAHWWQPGMHWPGETPGDDFGMGILAKAFIALGYEECPNGDREAGFEKVALYGSALIYTHAARQLANGKWTSKLGKGEDIEHDTPDDVAGNLYGEVVQFIKRPIQKQ
jgi:hypothetical protein